MKKSILFALLPLLTLGAIAPPAISKATLHTEDQAGAHVNSIAERTARETTTLRCWQEGKLLFEETHLSDGSSPKNAMTFAAEDERKIHLFNTGTATCMYKKI